MAKKKCVVNRNAEGNITSVEVQNYLSTPVETELYNKVSENPSVYETAIDNYVNDKTSFNQIMRDLSLSTKTELYDVLAELGVPIKIPLSEAEYNDIRKQLLDGLKKREIIEKYKINNYTYKFIANDVAVEFNDRQKVRPTLKTNEIAPETVVSILADRRAGMSVDEVYHKYDIPLAKLRRLFKANDLSNLTTEGAFESNAYVNNRKGIPFQSEKLNSWIQADSEFEIARFIELDADPNVKTYTRDVEPIAYNDGTKNRRYTPDIKVTYTDGRVEIEEIKPEFIVSKGKVLDQMLKDGSTMEEIRETMAISDTIFKVINSARIKMNAAREFYESQGIPYKILTENEIDTKLAEYDSITKSSKRLDNNAKRRAKYLELKENRTLPSQLFQELKEQPFMDENQALDAYKNIYSDDLNEWKDSDLDC